MSKPKKSTIEVQGTSISIFSGPDGDYISLTDMVRNFDGGSALIEQWLKNKDTVLFLGVWERINNPDFNSLEFEGIKNEAGRNSFFLSAKKLIALTGAKGLIASAGRYGGTYAHRDIAFEFGSWLSPEFKLYLIKEFQRLKDEENDRLKLGWNLQRTLSKINYRIHTDAIRETLIPPAITKSQAARVYANEADVLNAALFGQTAKQWRDANPVQACPGPHEVATGHPSHPGDIRTRGNYALRAAAARPASSGLLEALATMTLRRHTLAASPAKARLPRAPRLLPRSIAFCLLSGCGCSAFVRT